MMKMKPEMANWDLKIVYRSVVKKMNV